MAAVDSHRMFVVNPVRSQRNLIVPIVVWGLVFAFWFFVSRNNHPTLLLNALATSVLVGCSAAGVLVWQQAFSRRSFVVRTALRILCVVALGMMAAVIIRLFYDLLLGPDPRRFSFVSNLVMDIAFVAIHVLVAGVVARVSKLWA